jgi:hypothetical protein
MDDEISIRLFCQFFGFTVEAPVEVDESFAQVLPSSFGTRCWGLSDWLV